MTCRVIVLRISYLPCGKCIKCHLLAICAYNCCLCLCVYAKEGLTPLWHVVNAENSDMTKLLLDSKAKVNAGSEVRRWASVSVCGSRIVCLPFVAPL